MMLATVFWVTWFWLKRAKGQPLDSFLRRGTNDHIIRVGCTWLAATAGSLWAFFFATGLYMAFSNKVLRNINPQVPVTAIYILALVLGFGWTLSRIIKLGSSHESKAQTQDADLARLKLIPGAADLAASYDHSPCGALRSRHRTHCHGRAPFRGHLSRHGCGFVSGHPNPDRDRQQPRDAAPAPARAHLGYRLLLPGPLPRRSSRPPLLFKYRGRRLGADHRDLRHGNVPSDAKGRNGIQLTR
jgi:hypothetical protein